MGSMLSTVAGAVEAVMDWIVEGVKRVGRAIWRAMESLFGAMRVGFYWLRGCFAWIFGLQSTDNSTPVPSGPSPVPTPARGVANITTQQKQQMGQQAKKAKELLKEMGDIFEDLEEAMEANCSSEDSDEETERKLQEIQQRAHARNIPERMADLTGAAPVFG